MGLILRQIVVNDDWLRRVVEVVLDLFDLRDSGELRDIQRAILEGQAVRPIKPRVDRLDLAVAILLDDGVDLVEKAAADEHRALVPLPQRARIAYARRIDFNLKAVRDFQLVDRQLVGGSRNRWWRDRRVRNCWRHQVVPGPMVGGRREQAEPPAAARLRAKRR